MALKWILKSKSVINKNRILESWIAEPYDYFYKVARSVGGAYFFRIPEVDLQDNHTFIWKDDSLAKLMRYERKSHSIWEEIMKPANLIYFGNMPTNRCKNIRHGKVICELHWKHFHAMKQKELKVCRGYECRELIDKRKTYCPNCTDFLVKAYNLTDSTLENV